MRRIIFVGLHNKPGLIPLHPSTKTGKLIDRIVAKLPAQRPQILRTNLFEVEYLPVDEFDKYSNEWVENYQPTVYDIIVLMGAMVHENFPTVPGRKIKVAHPASMRSHEQMDRYVAYVSTSITSTLQIPVVI